MRGRMEDDMNILDRLCGALAGAWDLLLDFPLPEGMQEQGRKVRHETKLAAVPWLGFGFGLLFCLAGKFFAGVFHPVAGAVAFGVLLAAFLEFKESGRSPLLASRFLGTLITTGSFRQAAQTIGSGDEDEVPPLSAGLIPLFFILKAAAGYLLCRYGAAGWGIAVIAGCFSLQMAVAVAVEPPLFRVKDEYRNRLWISFSLVSFLVLLFHPAAALIGAACVIFGSRWFIARWNTRFAGDGITLAGALTEWVLLAVGLLFALS